MENFIIIAVLAVILVLVIRYIYNARKSGVKCIGCPNGGSCSGCCGNGEFSCDCGGCCEKE